jgi:hypothetical protein
MALALNTSTFTCWDPRPAQPVGDAVADPHDELRRLIAEQVSIWEAETAARKEG